MGYDGRRWMELAQDRVQGRDFGVSGVELPDFATIQPRKPKNKNYNCVSYARDNVI
jgi:hypothetical protein